MITPGVVTASLAALATPADADGGDPLHGVGRAARVPAPDSTRRVGGQAEEACGVPVEDVATLLVGEERRASLLM